MYGKFHLDNLKTDKEVCELGTETFTIDHLSDVVYTPSSIWCGYKKKYHNDSNPHQYFIPAFMKTLDFNTTWTNKQWLDKENQS